MVVLVAVLQEGVVKGEFSSRGEIDELDALYYDRTPPDWYRVTVDSRAGLGGRAYTLGNSVHLSGQFSMSPLGRGTEAFATLAHEAGHVVDFAGNFAGTLAGGISDQIKYSAGIDVYNPRISGAPLSSYGVEGRATLYEWSYRLYYGIPGGAGSNYPASPAAQQRLYDLLYP
jgi:hypothetical protein